MSLEGRHRGVAAVDCENCRKTWSSYVDCMNSHLGQIIMSYLVQPFGSLDHRLAFVKDLSNSEEEILIRGRIVTIPIFIKESLCNFSIHGEYFWKRTNF